MTTDYKLHLGDCLEVMKDIPSGSVDVIIADPPYGIDYQSARRNDKNTWFDKIANDKKPFVDWLPLAYQINDNDGCLLFFADGMFKKYLDSLLSVRDTKLNLKLYGTE